MGSKIRVEIRNYLARQGGGHLFADPVGNLTAFHVEIAPDEEEPLAGVHVAAVVVALPDLIQGGLLGLVALELEDDGQILIGGDRVNPLLFSWVSLPRIQFCRLTKDFPYFMITCGSVL